MASSKSDGGFSRQLRDLACLRWAFRIAWDLVRIDLLRAEGGAPFARLGARERLPQTVDRLSETGNLLREPLRVSLLRGEKAFHALQLILNDLQLVDRFLLGSFQTLGLLH